jgi:hypothetical protein
METLVLGWYVLIETGSVLLLSGSLQYFGTLVAPVFGTASDWLGHRNVLCAMRIGYATLAGVLRAFAFTGTLRPAHVFVIAGIAGLVRPSDPAMRSALVAETMRVGRFVTIGLARRAHSRWTCAEPQPGIDAGHAAARRWGDGHAHAGDLWSADRPDCGRCAGRSDWLRDDRDAVLWRGFSPHPADSHSLARRAMAVAGAGERAVNDRMLADG